MRGAHARHCSYNARGRVPTQPCASGYSIMLSYCSDATPSDSTASYEAALSAARSAERAALEAKATAESSCTLALAAAMQ